MTVIVNINHETGDLTQYTSTNGGTDISAAVAAAMAGTSYGLSILINDTNACSGRKDVSSTSGKVRGRFYLDPNTLTMANNDTFTIYRCWNSGVAVICGVDLNYTTLNGYRIRFFAMDDAGNYLGSSDYYAITDAPHYIEFYCVRAASGVSSDGTMTGWIDGVQKESLTGIDNYDRFVDLTGMRIGAVLNMAATTTGTFYLDELVVNDDGGAIGPVAPAVSVPVHFMDFARQRNV